MDVAAIRTELDQAAQIDAKAHEHRQRAGLMLRQAGALQDMHAVARKVGIDARMVELLLLMAPLSIASRKAWNSRRTIEIVAPIPALLCVP